MTSMENVIQNRCSSLSPEETATLKNELKFIQYEYNSKIEQQKKLKEDLLNVKNLFQSGLKEYQNETKKTIEKEQEIENLLSKNSKIKKNLLLSLSQTINSKFYSHLLEISQNEQKQNLLKICFEILFLINEYHSFNKENQNINNNMIFLGENTIIYNYNQSVYELLTIIKCENNIKNILSYSYEVFKNLSNTIEGKKQYDEIKKLIEKYINEINNNLEAQYPFGFLFDYLGNVFKIIDNEKKIIELKYTLDKMIEQKNKKFVEVKNLEGIIRKSNRKIKIILNYLRAIKNFYNRIKDQNSCDNYIIIIELMHDIEKFKKIEIDYEKLNPNFDEMTSLSFGTNYTLSEDSSILESKLNKLVFEKNNEFSKIENRTSNNIIINEEYNEKIKSKTINSEDRHSKSSKQKECNKNKKFKEYKDFLNKPQNSLNKKNRNTQNSIKNVNANINNNNVLNQKFHNNKVKSNINNKLYNTNSKSINQNCTKNTNNNKFQTFDIEQQNLFSPNSESSINDKQNENINKNIIENNNKKLKIKTSEQKNTLNNCSNSINMKSDKSNKYSKCQYEQYNNKYNLSKKVNQIKNKESENSMEMSLSKESVIYEDISENFGNNDIKDSICDEMISQNYGIANNFLRSSTNDYIKKLGYKNNILLSQNTYKTNFNYSKRKMDFQKLQIEKPINASSCCVSCT